MQRRSFLMYSIMSAPALAADITTLPLIKCEPEGRLRSGIKLSFQDGIAPGRNLEERFDYMEESGITGFEPRANDIIKNVSKYQKLLKYRNIRISAVQSGYKGFVCSGNRIVRNEYICIMKEIIASAGELGATGVIVVPETAGSLMLYNNNSDLYRDAIDHLYDLAEYAGRNNTTIILKPVNRKEAQWINTVPQAADICRTVNLKGLRCMGDLWYMTGQEVSDKEAILSGGEYLNHIHIASRTSRYMPGTDGISDNYAEAFGALKKINYKGFISFVCGITGDKNKIITSSIRLLDSQWQSS